MKFSQLGVKLLLAAVCWGVVPNAARAVIHEYYVGVDGLQTLASGTYAGLANPNYGRLIMLYAHPNETTPANNHFHGIGAYSYAGPAASPTVNATNANNRLPETYTGQAPLTLLPGSGPLAGKRISGLSGEPYGDLSLHSIHDLDGYAEMSPEWYMYHSSGGRYKATALDGLDLAVEIVSMTPGLKLGLDGLSEAGQQLAVGGESALPAELLFWTEGDAALGTYAAALRLVDRSGTFASSGTFNIDFAVIPEPSAAALGALALVSAGLYRRRQSQEA